MYLEFPVKIPDVPGKMTRRKKGEAVYIEYEYDRIYDPQRQFTTAKRSIIGKQAQIDPLMMQPN